MGDQEDRSSGKGGKRTAMLKGRCEVSHLSGHRPMKDHTEWGRVALRARLAALVAISGKAINGMHGTSGVIHRGNATNSTPGISGVAHQGDRQEECVYGV